MAPLFPPDDTEAVYFPRNDIFNNLGTFYRSAGRLDLALPFYRQALELRSATLDPLDPELVESYGNMAMHYESAGRFEDAVEFYQRVLEIQERTPGEEPPDRSRRGGP